MLDKLAQHLREGTITVPCEQTVREMRTFVRGDDGKPEAQEGCHDDRVISLGIALEMADRAYDEPGRRWEVPEYVVADTPTGL